MRKFFRLSPLLVIVLAACSLSAPEPTPIVITATPNVIPTLAITATTVPQLATRPPTNTPFPTDAPCIPQEDWFVYTVSGGDTLAGIALRAGTSVEALSLANCINPETGLNAEEGVRVPVAILPPATPTENANCPERWFFIFRPGKSEVTASCADPVIEFAAVGQDFEGGRMIRLPASFDGEESGSVIYVLYNNGFWEEYPDQWDPSQPSLDESIIPPEHRTQPAEGFGRVWRENPAVRTAMGWAFTAAQPFTGRVQFPQRRTDYWYLDYGTARLALRMTRSDVAPNPWEIAGEY